MVASRPARVAQLVEREPSKLEVAGSRPVARFGAERDRVDCGFHGEWRSLVAHPAGGRAVAGSNPVSPIERKPCVIAGLFAVLGTTDFEATGSNTGSNFCTATPIGAMKRPYGSGQIYEKWGAYYGRWRTPDGRRVNRRLGPEAHAGGSDGLTRAQAEQAFRRLQAEEAARRPIEPVVEIVTVDQAAERLRERIAIEGARLSYRQNCESMQRVHVSPAIGKRKVASVRTRGHRAAGEPDAGQGRVAEDRSQRDDVPALGVRVGGQEAAGRRRTRSPTRRGRGDAGAGRRQSGPAVLDARRARRRDRGDPGPHASTGTRSVRCCGW